MTRRLSVLLIAFLLCLCAAPLLAASQKMSRVEGRFFSADGRPLQHAVALFFSTDLGPVPIPQGYDWFSDVATPIIDDGRFSASIPPGKYWYGVIKMPDDLEHTRAHSDEWLYVSSKKDGTVQRVVVKPGKVSNMGDIKIPADMFAGRSASPVSVVSGRLLDQFKKPVAGFAVEAYSKNEKGALPVFASAFTDENGVYSIRLMAGVFFLKIRPTDKFTMKGQLNKNFNKYVLPLAHRISVGPSQDIPGVNIVMSSK